MNKINWYRVIVLSMFVFSLMYFWDSRSSDSVDATTVSAAEMPEKDYEIVDELAAEMPDKHCPYLPHRCLSKELWEFNDCFERWVDFSESLCVASGRVGSINSWTDSVRHHCKKEVLEGRKISAELVAAGREGNGYCLSGVESAAETLKDRAEAEASQSRLVAPHIGP